MASPVSVDTSFLIDVQRERRRGDGPALAWLRANDEVELLLSVVALAEFSEGFASLDDPLVVSIAERHTLLPIDAETALLYSRVTRDLRRAGDLIGTNDLWIACCSLRADAPVLTANTDDFGRVRGLQVVDYRAA